MGYSFVMFESGLKWSRTTKGMAFSAAMGMIWMVYLFEPLPIGEGASLTDLIAYPLADGLSVIVLGFLLGRYVSTTSGQAIRPRIGSYGALLLAPTVLLATRLLAYHVIGIYSSYDDRTWDTILWVLASGFIIGTAYGALREGVPSSDPLGRSLAFGIFFFGVPVMLINLFVGLALMIDWVDMFLRLSLDILAVITSVFLYEVYLERRERLPSLSG